MSRLAACSLLAVVVLVASCGKDQPLEQRSTKRADRPALSSASAGKQSTVCASYRRQLAMTRLQLRVTTSQVLKARELTLNALIADACE